MPHQQLHPAAVTEVVGFQLIGQMQARGWWGAGKTTEVDGVRVDDFSLTYGPWKLNDSKLRFGTWLQGEHSVQATVEGGIVETPVYAREDLRMRLQELESTRPDLPQRTELQRKVLELREQLLYMRRTRQRDDLARPAGAAESAPAPLPKAIAAAAAPSIPAATVPLQERSVLCVGGRTASVPAYRALIERAGARFLHHDGGEEDSTSRLDATLAAADLVICQTGCISHGAYWRVKDHCRRTGKRCVFVEQPSASSLQRALQSLAATVQDPDTLDPSPPWTPG